VVLLQTVAIAYLVLPFGGRAKHPINMQAGKLEIVDQSGMVRAKLTSEYGQTMFAMYDAKGETRLLLRENDEGFVTMEFFDRLNNQKTMTLFSGTKRSFLELHDPKTRRGLNVQAGAEGIGVMEFDERGQVLP
jgi:hypothetical protein